MLLSPRVPEIQLKNSKGLSNEKINELKSRLVELAKQRCGEVRAFYILEKYGLTLAGCQVPTNAALSLSSSAGQGGENIMKGSWVEIRTGRDHSAITITGKTDSTWGKLI